MDAESLVFSIIKIAALVLVAIPLIYLLLLIRYKCYSPELFYNLALIVIIIIVSIVYSLTGMNTKVLYLLLVLMIIYFFSLPIYVWRQTEDKCPQIKEKAIRGLHGFLKYFLGGIMIILALAIVSYAGYSVYDNARLKRKYGGY